MRWNLLRETIQTVLIKYRDENKRHRQQILETSHFFEFQRQEFNSIGIPQHLDLTNIDLDNDVTVEI